MLHSYGPHMRTRNRRYCLVGFIAAVLLWTNASAAKDIDERRWIYVESGNFSVYSALNEKKTRKLLLHLEALRAVFAIQFGGTSQLEEKPTRILALAKRSDYRTLGMPENSAGAFTRDLRENYIVIGNSSRMSESQVILHEYVHFIVQATQRFPYPIWWEEGYAEYVSGSKLSKQTFSYGLTQKGRLFDLLHTSWIPWETILNTSSFSDFNARQTAMYYAQSWLLVHYLFNRGESAEAIGASWEEYLRELHNGSSTVIAFERSFGIELSDMKKALKRYIKDGRYTYVKIPTDSLVPEFASTSRRASPHDIHIQLGRLALRNADADKAASWFTKALAIDAQSPAALAGWAATLALGQQYEDARTQFDLALSNAPDDPVILVDYAKFELQRAANPDAWFTRIDHLDIAEQLLLKARSSAGSNVEIDTYLAFIWLNRESGSTAALDLLRDVSKRSPSDQWPLLLRAEGLFLEGNSEDALSLARSVIRYDHGRGNYSRDANRLIQRIQGTGKTQDSPLPQIEEPDLPSTN